MRATEFVDSYLHAWNQLDPVGVADHLASNGLYHDIPDNVQHTHDQLITSLDDFFSTYRHRYELVGKILTDKDTVAFQYRMIPNEREGGDEAVYHGAEFVTLRNDSAVMIADYYDVPLQPTHAPVAETTLPRTKYAKSGLSGQQMDEYKERLEDVMRSQQIYLQSDLTLPQLADAVDCSVNHLSQVINAGFGVSFFDYLNRYRVEHSRQLLTHPESQENAILNVAYAVGFNSNSAFYAAFKRYVGQTPAHYRKEQLQRCR